MKLKTALSLAFLSLFTATASPVLAAENTQTTLFKVVTAEGEMVIGLNEAEMRVLGGTDAGAVSQALTDRGQLTVWQYAVKKADNGDLQQAPRQKIGLSGNGVMRVEPYKSPLAVLPHE